MVSMVSLSLSQKKCDCVAPILQINPAGYEPINSPFSEKVAHLVRSICSKVPVAADPKESGGKVCCHPRTKEYNCLG